MSLKGVCRLPFCILLKSFWLISHMLDVCQMCNKRRKYHFTFRASRAFSNRNFVTKSNYSARRRMCLWGCLKKALSFLLHIQAQKKTCFLFSPERVSASTQEMLILYQFFLAKRSNWDFRFAFHLNNSSRAGPPKKSLTKGIKFEKELVSHVFKSQRLHFLLYFL